MKPLVLVVVSFLCITVSQEFLTGEIVAGEMLVPTRVFGMFLIPMVTEILFCLMTAMIALVTAGLIEKR